MIRADIRDDFGLSKIHIETDIQKRHELEQSALESARKTRLRMEKEGRINGNTNQS